MTNELSHSSYLGKDMEGKEFKLAVKTVPSVNLSGVRVSKYTTKQYEVLYK